MSPPSAMPRPSAPEHTGKLPAAAVWLTGAGLLLAVFLAYANGLGAPFQFDDQPAVRYNETIRHLWPPGGMLQPPADGAGVTGRPLVNVTLAINYALGGLDARGYHLLNVLLHAGAVLALWGVLRRTLRGAAVPAWCREQAEGLAGSVALVWAVHPLLTESVVCVVQRNEVLAGLFYLLTLYGLIRSAEAGAEAPGRWQALAVVACLLGMASKEIVATAPLMALLYDRTFLAGTFREAWRRREGFYIALAATWLPLAWLMLGSHQRAGAVGFGLGVSSWEYLLTQCRALMIYLQLSVWPHPLVVDYGTPLVRSVAEVWAQGVVVVALLVGTGWALWRRPVIGFVGAWFFLILAPSSSLVPLTTQTIAEHRMYLPLIAVVVLGLAGVGRFAGSRSVLVAAGLAVALGWGTHRRNTDYLSELILWTDTVEKAPDNQRAHLNLGQVLFQSGQVAQAEEQFAEALRLKPDYAEAHYNLGLAQARLGRPAEAIAHFEAALRLVPDYAVAHSDLGIALAQTGRPAEAQAQFEAALQSNPDFAGAHFNLANLLLRSGRPAEAIPHYERALAHDAGSAEYHGNLALALMRTGRKAEAIAHYEAAVGLQPASAESQLGLALALAASGRLGEAVEHAREAVRLKPDFAAARHYLTEMESDFARSGGGKR